MQLPCRWIAVHAAGLVFLLLLIASSGLGSEPSRPADLAFPDETIDRWQDHLRHNFTFQGRQAWVVEPAKPLPGNPWSWCMMFPDAFTRRCAAPQLLAAGFHHAYLDVGNTFGCPDAIAALAAFHDELVRRGLAQRAALIGISRGGLYAQRFAAEHPGSVSAIYGDNPVCDFRSWPGGKGSGRGSPQDWAACLAAYKFAGEPQALEYQGNPVDALEPLAKAGIAIIHVVGDRDDIVPPAENALVVERRYRQIGGTIEVIHEASKGHHPHGLEDPQPVVDFLLAHAVADPHRPSAPYDVRPEVEPPYFRLRYDASAEPGGLIFPVSYTAWLPPGMDQLQGLIVHQHGCGEGSCKSGLTAAYDLHWQALARKHACGLVAPSYEQPEKADCQMWCDPRNGSDAAFQRALGELGRISGHPELEGLPWALWGHSGGGHWAGGMTLLHPDRVVAAWLRSGVPLFEADEKRPGIKPHLLPDGALTVPIMCNPGTQEGVTVTDGRFKIVWPANKKFFTTIRSRGGLVGVAIDPKTAHECGNQRYLAIPWLDACLTARLPKPGDKALQPMPTADAWLAPIEGGEAMPAATQQAAPLASGWLPDEAIARKWSQYVADTAVADDSPPPPPTNLHLSGRELTWEASADLESGLAGFIIERDGERLAKAPLAGKNPFGRSVFQGLQYSDTPVFPLVPLRFVDETARADGRHRYRIIAVNTAGLESAASEPISRD